MLTHGFAAHSAGASLMPFEFERREPRPTDVVIDIEACGICHTDLHYVANDWGMSMYPLVPGHEIVGRVSRAGAQVTRLKAGQRVGVGCMVDSCRACDACKRGLEQFCEKGVALTYSSTEMDRKTPTFGGYSTRIVVDEAFVCTIPDGLPPAAAAPLLCAGITTYSPLRQFGCKRGDRVAVVGLGGLGHLAVKLARAMGAEVTVLSTSPAKEADARRLGAAHFEVTADDAAFAKLANRFDLILDTVAAPHDYNRYLSLLRVQGTMVLVGLPAQPTPLSAFSLVAGNRRLSGSLFGGIRETQEMLDFCGAHGIAADVELIRPDAINDAFRRLARGDVRYRFVLDLGR